MVNPSIREPLKQPRTFFGKQFPINSILNEENILEMGRVKREAVIAQRKSKYQKNQPQKIQFHQGQQVLLLAIRLSSAVEAESRKFQHI